MLIDAGMGSYVRYMQTDRARHCVNLSRCPPRPSAQTSPAPTGCGLLGHRTRAAHLLATGRRRHTFFVNVARWCVCTFGRE
eukprot:6313362-Prymnesium_polylepis.1